MAYQLYYSKENCILEIKPAKAVFKNINITDEIMKYNDRYYFCNSRKLLKEKALELKEEWWKEAKERLQMVADIEV